MNDSGQSRKTHMVTGSMSRAEEILQWCILCLTILVPVFGDAVCTAALVVMCLAMLECLRETSRYSIGRVVACAVTGGAAVQFMSLGVGRGTSIVPGCVGAAIGIASAFGPATIRCYLLSICLCMAVLDRRGHIEFVSTLQMCGLELPRSDSARWWTGGGEFVLLGAPGSMYYVYCRWRDTAAPVHSPSHGDNNES